MYVCMIYKETNLTEIWTKYGRKEGVSRPSNGLFYSWFLSIYQMVRPGYYCIRSNKYCKASFNGFKSSLIIR